MDPIFSLTSVPFLLEIRTQLVGRFVKADDPKSSFDGT
jgi:hypothetical protein